MMIEDENVIFKESDSFQQKSTSFKLELHVRSLHLHALMYIGGVRSNQFNSKIRETN